MIMASTHRIVHDWKLIPILKSRNWGNVLDVGSKDARYKKYMEFSSYEKLDIDSSFHPDILGDIEFYTSTKKYDTIIMTAVIEHIRHPEVALKSINHLLKEGGCCIVTVPFIFQNHGEDDYWRYSEPGCRLLFGTYFSKVGVTGYGNFISSSWDILHFFNRIPLLNHLVAWLSLTFSSRHCPSGFIVEAIK
jgi:SAM-dependent methyltransferase